MINLFKITKSRSQYASHPLNQHDSTAIISKLNSFPFFSILIEVVLFFKQSRKKENFKILKLFCKTQNETKNTKHIKVSFDVFCHYFYVYFRLMFGVKYKSTCFLMSTILL